MTTFKARSLFMLFLMTCAFGVIVARLFVVQILENKYYAQQSKKQTQERAMLQAKRGTILDRKGQVLATSIDNRVKMNPVSADPDPLSAGANADARTNGALGVKRLYPFGECAGAVLGYIGKDGAGLGGAEFYFDRFLKGENGWAILNRDGRNNKYSKIGLPQNQPHPGDDVYLTLDLDIQKIAENVLLQAVEGLKACGGMCIIMEPKTGKILAMAGNPPFNPNQANQYQLSQRLNRCINYTYEPGSTFKVVTAACALQENVKKETDTIDGNNGSYDIVGEKIRDKKPYGHISFLDAFKFSSNVCFARVANDIGNDRLYTYAKDFGFGAQTGIQLPGEEIGIVHPIDKWSGRTRVTMAIGQEISVTLLQMSLLFAAIANGGVLVEPRMYEKIVSPDGTVVDSTRYAPVRRVLSADVAARLTAMMTAVISSGTGTKAAIKGVSVAGKTGTAQKIERATGTYSEKKAWASFIGFLPAENPLLLGAVVIDEPANAEMGGAAAAPVFQKIMSQIITHPQLEYAEKVLHQGGPADTNGATNAPKARPVPDVCGMSAESAVDFLRSERIPCELVGDRNGKIAFQAPGAGKQLPLDRKMILYTSPAQVKETAAAGMVMPNCLGKDLRDAINAVNLKGLVPHVRGAGTVMGQVPRAGVSVSPGAPCTLSCSFGTYAQCAPGTR